MMTEDENKNLKNPDVDEDYLLNIISGDLSVSDKIQSSEGGKENKSREKSRSSFSKKISYEDLFLVNRFPSGRFGKVVYIRPEYHERLLRIVQVTTEEKTTLYSYIDAILQYHFTEFGDDITRYFNERFKPIL